MYHLYVIDPTNVTADQFLARSLIFPAKKHYVSSIIYVIFIYLHYRQKQPNHPGILKKKDKILVQVECSG